MDDRRPVHVGNDATRLGAVEKGREGGNRIARHGSRLQRVSLREVGAHEPRGPRVGRRTLERVLTVGDERDVRCEGAKLPLQGDETLIHRGP